MCSVIWLKSSGQYQWHLGYIIAEQDEGFLVDHGDHLYRTAPTCHIRLAYPVKEDVHVADNDQILQYKVVGEWDVKYPRNTLVYFGECKRYTESF